MPPLFAALFALQLIAVHQTARFDTLQRLMRRQFFFRHRFLFDTVSRRVIPRHFAS